MHLNKANFLWGILLAFLTFFPSTAQLPREIRDRALPQDHAYQKTLYAWIKSLDQKSFDIPVKAITWDGTLGGNTPIEKLQASVGLASTYLYPTSILRIESRWFVLDDKKGGGIEGSGVVRHPRWANMAAFWYDIDLPLKNGTQGNPYYRHRGVALRAMVTTALDLMMLDKVHTYNARVCRSDFLGGTMTGWVYAYGICKSILDQEVVQAFELGFERMLDKYLFWKARDVNTNMDMRAISAAALMYEYTDNPVIKDKCIRVARLFLFGHEDGSLEKHDPIVGTYYRAGYIAENEGPETTYNGVSFYHLMEAKAAVAKVPQWSFLDDVLRAMIQFKNYQVFREPNGQLNGPSGYACRTGGPYISDQRSRAWRDIAAAALYPEALPLVHRLANSSDPKSAHDKLVKNISVRIDTVSRRSKLGQADKTPPIAWQNDHSHHWPPDNPYFANPGFRKTILDKLANPDSATTRFPFDRKAGFSRLFGKPGAEEFWAHKNHDGHSDFGFFIEHVPRTWPYGSWAGGSLQCFWSRHTGILLMSRHAKTGDEAHKMENSRVWSDIDRWATDHVWGRSSVNMARVFSSATTFNVMASKVKSDLNALPPYVEAKTGFSFGKIPIYPKTFFTHNRFEATKNGLRVIKKVHPPGTLPIKELWASIPVYLREARLQKKLQDTSIEVAQGEEWLKMSDKLVATSRIRLTRVFNDIPRRAIITFLSPQRVRLSQSVWLDNYQSRVRMRNIHIDLHGAPGQSKKFSKLITATYEIHIVPPDSKP